MNLRIEEEEGEGAMRGIGGFPLIPPLLKEGNTSSTTIPYLSTLLPWWKSCNHRITA